MKEPVGEGREWDGGGLAMAPPTTAPTRLKTLSPPVQWSVNHTRSSSPHTPLAQTTTLTKQDSSSEVLDGGGARTDQRGSWTRGPSARTRGLSQYFDLISILKTRLFSCFFFLFFGPGSVHKAGTENGIHTNTILVPRFTRKQRREEVGCGQG